jgi:FKBP-type peptidyl-prolyl cis-trans isomerase
MVALIDAPFKFKPGLNLIVGWTEGVLQMKEGERALLHIPSEKGYGGKPMGQKGGVFFIPENSNLLFDIEILGKAGMNSEF